jgi:3-oxoacyl-[acyl-carrier protein] reductase
MAAVDLGAHNITVNVVARGWIDVDWARPFLHTEGRAFVEEGIPVGRIGRTEDVGALCCFLASEAAQYITGAVIPVDGGYTLTRSAGTSPYSQKR